MQTVSAPRGMVVAPHHLASQAGLSVLRDGGNALEAMVAAAAAIAVVYPHMNNLGGDGFWLVHRPGQVPLAIDACGRSGAGVDVALYREQGLASIPARGPFAANTVAGTVSGWQAALQASAELGGQMPLARLFEEAIHYAETGMPVSRSQAALTAAKAPEMTGVPGFSEVFLPGGVLPAEGERFTQPRLAETLRRLAREGLDSFYRGPLGRSIAADLERAGSPLTRADLRRHRASRPSALSIPLTGVRAFNLPPPTQGLASLAILGIFDRLAERHGVRCADEFAHVHLLVEAAKQAFALRDREITDPAYMAVEPEALLQPAGLDAMAGAIDASRAAPWTPMATRGDTVWLGAIDAQGIVVSFIQSIYWEFGSGVVLEETGLQWQNRGASFQLTGRGPNRLEPDKKPFHTLNPALALFNDGKVMAYGTMGGEGQPQTQSAIFTRYARFGVPLGEAVGAPRWLLGRTWGAESTTLKLESRYPAYVLQALRAAGHDVEVVAAYDEVMGHAGALVRLPDGTLEGAADPRSDGAVAAY